MKLKDSEVTYMQKTTKVVVEVKDGVFVTAYVHRVLDSMFDNYEYEVDYEKGSEDILANLTDEERDELDDIVAKAN